MKSQKIGKWARIRGFCVEQQHTQKSEGEISGLKNHRSAGENTVER